MAAGSGRWRRPEAPVREVVRVFESDPDLLADVPAGRAERLVLVGAPALRAEPGAWSPPCAEGARHLGFLVVDGLLVRTVRLAPHGMPELVGPGDLIRPDEHVRDDLGLAAADGWEVLEPARLAELDDYFAERVADAPEELARLLERTSDRVGRLALQAAVAHVRSAERRILLTLWHLADRWGRVTPNGILVPLPLTHRLLGELAALRRPTTTSAISRLSREGRVSRTTRGHWVLHGSPPA